MSKILPDTRISRSKHRFLRTKDKQNWNVPKRINQQHEEPNLSNINAK